MAISKHAIPVVKSESTDDLKVYTQLSTNEIDTQINSSLQITPSKVATQTRRSSTSRTGVSNTKKTSRPRKTTNSKEQVAASNINQDNNIQQEELIAARILPDIELASAPVTEQNQFIFTEHVQTFLTAIQDGKAVELSFVDTENNPSRIFEPRQLIFDAFIKNWYIWGWDRRYNTERHHLLSLIAQANIIEGLGRTAPIACAYKSNASANLIGGLLGGDIMRVKVILLKQWIYAVRQAPMPFLDFKIEDIEDGKAQVTFIATDLRAVGRWVMQFGDGIQVLEPQRLVDRIKQVGLAWSGRSSLASHAIKAAQYRQESRQDYHNDNKYDSLLDRRTIEHNKQHHNRESLDSPKSNKIEIRTDRL